MPDKDADYSKFGKSSPNDLLAQKAYLCPLQIQ